MSWPRADPVAEIDRLIKHHRDDQIAQEKLRGDAIEAKRRADGAGQAAEDLQHRAELAIDLDAEEINRLFEERAVYLPTPREGE